MQDGQSDEDSNETRSGMLESSQFPSPQLHITSTNVYNQNTHILLLLTWLLPLAAPVLAVWVRTLLTAGYTTPFNGDHNFLKVAPVLVLVEYTSRRSETLLFSEKRISVRWGFIVLASVAFLAGSRTVFRVYDFANLQIALIVIARIGWRYFVRDGSSDSRSS
ncbi:hypothetical protein SERLADRAFT_461706 [Serpula lacrymans var. lacrymans S7.9]|nr:uncharacterized protein SERLADRAFT_461706 [Serpula lacrymans var. lacrymans S7.9]EGO27743.1 hypothetical protein SERLADRAFT_461706 [Serpula lacrymans var. lacrymans S7.9]